MKTISQTAVTAAGLAAWRCWSWHCCGCIHADDCILLGPLPVHADQPCRGMFGDSGTWQSCCTAGGAS
jgi:hypothetical protein